jgi:hypothetical protein
MLREPSALEVRSGRKGRIGQNFAAVSARLPDVTRSLLSIRG